MFLSKSVLGAYKNQSGLSAGLGQSLTLSLALSVSLSIYPPGHRGRVTVPGLRNPPHTLMGIWGVKNEYNEIIQAIALKSTLSLSFSFLFFCWA